MGIRTELRFVDQNGKEFWTDDAGRISYVKPVTLERVCESTTEPRLPGTSERGSGVAKNPAPEHVTGFRRHEIDGMGSE